ncbi:Protein cms1 [Neophaeococcomyces mojaviensis]|uniref:Protein cms1 n=1 Tax=Neophaeococcomyces mojaviensis TaxID=3383035 RepID=A0ACC2ZQQ5_9EURO|nr:Protein cms1 [Knufia sp. JES_112]
MVRTKNHSRKRTGKEANGKRKRDDVDDVDDALSEAKKRAAIDDDITVRTEQTVYDKTVASENPEELAGRFTSAIKDHRGDLSTIELEDQSIPAKAFRDTTDFEETRLVKNICQFLEKYAEGGPDELKACSQAASPHTLIISPSAIRTQDVLREIRKYGSEESKVAKLFGKHIKLKDSVEYVKKTKFGIGGGTCGRIKDLIEHDTLKLDHLKRIVIDASYVDEKQRTIFSDRDAFPPMASLLNLEPVKLRLVAGQTELLVF